VRGAEGIVVALDPRRDGAPPAAGRTVLALLDIADIKADPQTARLVRLPTLDQCLTGNAS
jgi:hypothetical protein